MRRYSWAVNFARIFFMVVLVLGLIAGGLIWLDFLGIINVRKPLSPVLSFLGIQSAQIVDAPFSPVLLDNDRLSKERQAIVLERRQLEKSAEELVLREAELARKESEVTERESSVEEKQNSLSVALGRYDNKVRNLEQTARYLMNMPPNDAVAIMDQYDLKDLVDVLRTSERLSQKAGEDSLVAFWLSLMSDKSRAAEIQGLLVEKPGMNLEG